jgi:hypothetical protein
MRREIEQAIVTHTMMRSFLARGIDFKVVENGRQECF